jgi:hypothetical protein
VKSCRNRSCLRPTVQVAQYVRRSVRGPVLVTWIACERGYHRAVTAPWQCDGSDICEMRGCPSHGGEDDLHDRRETAVNAAEKNAASRKARAAKRADAPKEATKKPSLTDLPEPELRAKLLASPTLPDSAWAPKLAKPKRAEGESRTAYIERVLASE